MPTEEEFTQHNTELSNHSKATDIIFFILSTDATKIKILCRAIVIFHVHNSD